tara:strand:+ start:258 stop:581 length:324 start_codon:yes stop_codon:yes gene_type:complete
MKTIKLIESYYKLLEQDGVEGEGAAVDATEVAAEVPEEAPVLTTEAEIYLTKLAALAFSYSPTPEEENLINTLSQEYGQSEPKRVTDQIQDLLQSSNQALEKELNEV